MKLTCPSCGAVMSLDVLIAHQGAREAVVHALDVPAPLGRLLVQYVALFRPAKRELSIERVGRILAELLPLIRAAQIERGGRVWPAPLDYWVSAIEEMLERREKLTLPLKSHGYLLEIIAGIGNRAESRAETKREAERAYPFHEARSTAGPVPVAQAERAPMPAQTREAIDKLLRRRRGDA